MTKPLTTEEWDLVHDLLEEYYKLHSRIVNNLVKKLPEHAQGEFLMMANERNSVYGRDTTLVGNQIDITINPETLMALRNELKAWSHNPSSDNLIISLKDAPIIVLKKQ